ncbi:MAG TPA: GNAT family N-acetyltransferase [Ramlibacter sp.]|nr:GNAT family N-acetyltransferase [Ramlibacter sp.]
MQIRRITKATEADIEGLCDVLVDCVEGGASIGFILPMTRDKAQRFWRKVADSAAREERVLFVAEEGDRIVGTVQVVFDLPENQPHRGDVAKMQVHRSQRKKGVGEALMRAAEEAAREVGRTLLVLDTASADAERLYERCGFTRVGAVPDFALLPAGGYCDTVFFYKQL